MGNCRYAVTVLNLIIVLIIFHILPVSAALPYGTGMGIIIGDPTGFTIKHFFSRRKAIDFSAGYDLDSHLQLHSDYTYHIPSVIPSREPGLKHLAAYIPIGGKLYYREKKRNRDKDMDETEVSAGLRFGGGLLYYLAQVPLEFFFEAVPTMDFFPGTHFSIDIAIGARYYFN